MGENNGATVREQLTLDMADGLVLVGEFVGIRERKPREVDGRTYMNVDVGLRLRSGSIEVVTFSDRSSAIAACAGAQVGDRLAVLAVNRFGVKDGRAWQFYTGARETEAPAFADEFGPA